MIEQFVNERFDTPTSGSPDNHNRVYSQTNEDIAYELFRRGVVGSTNVALKKMKSWTSEANENPGLVKNTDLKIRSQKHNEGAAYYIRFTVLDVIPPGVKEVPKRPDSDKNRKRNKVIKKDVHNEIGGGGVMTISRAQASLIKTARKTKKSAKAVGWSDLKAKATSKTRTEAKDEKTKKRKTNEKVEDEEVEVDEWEEVDDEEEWSPDEN
jgi:hypothetical protein